VFSELDALLAAKILIDEHGACQASLILMERAMDEHFAGREHDHTVTQQVLAALTKLTKLPAVGELLH